MDEDHDAPKRQVLREGLGWAACLLGAVMPTAVVTSLMQTIEGKTAPWFAPGVFIGLFTLMVLAMRPWSRR